jgi:general secretion pathway protein M
MMWGRLQGAFEASPAGRWFASLEPRDRSIVAALAGGVALAVIYLGIWSPVAEWSARVDARYQRQLAVLDWMRSQEQAARLAGQRGDNAANSSGSLLTLVANSAANAGVQLVRYQPEGSGGISVVLQAQPFNALVQWLAELEQRDQVHVKQISIDAQAQSGLVNARINLI